MIAALQRFNPIQTYITLLALHSVCHGQTWKWLIYLIWHTVWLWAQQSIISGPILVPASSQIFGIRPQRKETPIFYLFLGINCCHGIYSSARDGSHAGSGRHISIFTPLPRLICLLQSKVYGNPFQHVAKLIWLGLAVGKQTEIHLIEHAQHFCCHGNICVLQLLDKSDSAPDCCLRTGTSFFKDPPPPQ